MFELNLKTQIRMKCIYIYSNYVPNENNNICDASSFICS